MHGIWTLPKTRTFNLTQQLEHKAQIASSLSHRWILHQDADEILHPQAPDQTLADIALEAEAAGANAINFDEFVFLPPSNQSVREETPHHAFLNYYFFEPTPKRLMRLWRKGAGLKNLSGAGHHLNGDARLFAQSQVLRHYIGRSHEHLISKYVGRRFADEDLNKNWHSNRLGIRAENLDFKRLTNDDFMRLPSPESRCFKRDRPHRKHFWQVLRERANH